MISNSIPVSFLYCCLIFLPRSDKLLSVRVKREILHWVWRVAGLFSGEAKLKSPEQSPLCHRSWNPSRAAFCASTSLQLQPGFPQRGTYSRFSQRRGSQTLGSFTERWINEREKRNTAGSCISLLFDLVIQSYKVIVNTVISVLGGCET